MDTERALFTLSCTLLVACGSSTVVMILDRLLYQENDSVLPSREGNKTSFVESKQGCNLRETVFERGVDGPNSLDTLKEDFQRRMKRKEQEETEQLEKQVESSVSSALPRVFRLVGQHLVTPVVIKRLDQLRELYFHQF
ncbi:hypothetical protein Gasu2_57730 [Galdieria sulphuraria]|uniref:Uncharacterized protein n=1 Tax=Galdieria sulphuraria TaxID=130081 RepID=M2Y2Z3_GALSU|nr:uncharacterized protein Gasu_25570 [Galdieria sulphuraria]EME30184.1 hypothetical protein Gasu_25570 [Galdieria sulphuraria]GJD11648.1 hypothetical protein Gasu2_57730 [Galdieria sulphuraria]|eukprot:XP_005706704.1 hypothetical protein Gasu_25570 [Galdieria sulphuraria]